jgi:copper transport protein
VKFSKRTFWLTILILAYSAWMVIPVSAHALLVRSVPSANEVLEKSPAQVEIFFSEPLEPELSSISVYDSNNQVVDAGDVRVDPTNPKRMTVSLRSLVDGVYTVSWKVVSSIDGHQTVGAFPFAVGNANAEAVRAIQQSSNARIPFSALFAKFIMLASLALLAGQRLFIALIWEPALKTSREVGKPRIWRNLHQVGMNGILFSIGLGILSQAGQTDGNELVFPWNPAVGNILLETRLGLIWLARLCLAFFAFWLTTKKETAVKNWIRFITNVALLFTITLTSHAATESKPLIPILADLFHMIGMVFWLGGLVYLFTGIRHLRQLDDATRADLTSRVTSNFSFNAILFVSLIGITGLYSASLRVGKFSALLTSLYGHTLLVKQLFVIGLLVIAAINLLVISPRLRNKNIQGEANTSLITKFGRIMIFELLLAGLLLASVSFLTYVPPAKIVSPNTDFSKTQKVDDLKVKITISPAQVGQNEFTTMVNTSDGQPLESAREVLLRFTPAQANIPPFDLQLISDGGGKYSAKGTYLSSEGQWQVQAIIRRKDKFDAFANFDITLQKPGTSTTSASFLQTGSLLLLTGLLATLTASSFKNNTLRLGLGLPLGLLLIFFGTYYLFSPSIIENIQANPIPANQESIAIGQELFAINCAPCHGASGKGDGPVGLTLNPRPADLTLHAIAGIHSDAQLYEWITNGFPGSQMPAFKNRLSDTSRWHLVNFIRTLAPKE